MKGLIALRLPHVTLADPDLRHQVVLVFKNSQVHVSCNCMLVTGYAMGNEHESMGATESLEQSRAIYNDPKNHRGGDFTEEFTATW